MVLNAKDRYMTSRLTKKMSSIKNLDSTSIRGKRNVGVRIATAEGKTLLKGFDFNKEAILSSILFNPYSLDGVTGVITLNGFKPKQDLEAPSGATHVTLRGAWAKIDFATNSTEVFQTNEENVALDNASSDVTMTPSGTPVGTGTDIFLLQLEFFQEVNGVQYTLKNGAYNSMSIIEVA